MTNRETSPKIGAGSIALVGDVHSAWTAADVAYFNDTRYELVLITGDLGGSEARDGLGVARSMAGLTRRTLVMPGNNDVAEYAKIAAELTYRQARGALLGGEGGAGVRTCGYSAHPLRIGSLDLTVIAARPFAMGGSQLSFPEALEQSFGVTSLDASIDRLRALVDAATDQVIFFAHNGPTGLGTERDALWGRDFDPAEGDWGDRDLRLAIDYARAQQRRVLAVVAGHMHWSLRGGGSRRWQLQGEDGILYVNTARVPRIAHGEHGRVRHHLALELEDGSARVREVRVSEEPLG